MKARCKNLLRIKRLKRMEVEVPPCSRSFKLSGVAPLTPLTKRLCRRARLRLIGRSWIESLNSCIFQGPLDGIFFIAIGIIDNSYH